MGGRTSAGAEHAEGWRGTLGRGAGPGAARPLTGLGAIAPVADLAQAVVALVDGAQPVLQLRVLAVQHVLLDAAHVQRADDVLLGLCGDRSREGLAAPRPLPGTALRRKDRLWRTRADPGGPPGTLGAADFRGGGRGGTACRGGSAVSRAPSVLLRASSRTLYSCTFSLWCWSSRHSLASSSLENFPELFAWRSALCEPARAPARPLRPGGTPAPGPSVRPVLAPMTVRPGDAAGKYKATSPGSAEGSRSPKVRERQDPRGGTSGQSPPRHPPAPRAEATQWPQQTPAPPALARLHPSDQGQGTSARTPIPGPTHCSPDRSWGMKEWRDSPRPPPGPTARTAHSRPPQETTGGEHRPGTPAPR